VRPFLIAYNIYLDSDRVEPAKRVAAAVRHSSGGLREVQALGLLVDGQAQVSMNLTDFNATPIHRVQEMVRREASRYGLNITRAELVGLIPQRAMLDASRWYLQLDDMGDDQVLELRIAHEDEADFAPHALLEATAAGTPTPGGGSAAAVAAALAAALTQMVAGLTVGRKKYSPVEPQALAILWRAGELRQRLTLAVLADAAAFDRLMAASRNKELDEEARAAAVEQATIQAALVPLDVARLAREVAELALDMVRTGNVNAVSDAAAAVLLAQAAIYIAAMNVRINAVSVRDRAQAESWLAELPWLESRILELSASAISEAGARAGFAT
jgi:glutamate formiminotransferase/formiminotetrahydrofolate cyclodeaminase